MNLKLTNVLNYMYHIFFIHSPVDGHLDEFHDLTILDNAAIKVGVHVSFWIRLSLGISPVVGLLGIAWVHVHSLQSCPTLCDPMDCNLQVSSVHGILQARILEWVVNALLQGISPTQESNEHLVHLLHCRQIVYSWATEEAPCWVIWQFFFFTFKELPYCSHSGWNNLQSHQQCKKFPYNGENHKLQLA